MILENKSMPFRNDSIEYYTSEPPTLPLLLSKEQFLNSERVVGNNESSTHEYDYLLKDHENY